MNAREERNTTIIKMSSDEAKERSFESAKKQLDDLKNTPGGYMTFDRKNVQIADDQEDDDGEGYFLYVAPSEERIQLGHHLLDRFEKASLPPPRVGSDDAGGIYISWDKSFRAPRVDRVVLWIYPEKLSLITEVAGKVHLTRYPNDESGCSDLLARLRDLLHRDLPI